MIKKSDSEPNKKIGKVSNKKSFEEIDKKREEEFIEDLKKKLVLTVRVEQIGLIK